MVRTQSLPIASAVLLVVLAGVTSVTPAIARDGRKADRDKPAAAAGTTDAQGPVDACDPDAVPPPPPAHPEGWGADDTQDLAAGLEAEAALVAWVDERLAAQEATGGADTDCGRSYEISGSIPSVPSEIRLSGHACSFEQPFEVKTKGDITGTLRFLAVAETAGDWTYKGKVSNAPFEADGSGTYLVDLSDDGSSGAIDHQIPGVAEQSGGGQATLTLAPAAPCTD